MDKLEYNIRIWEKKKKTAEWQTIGALFVLAGLVIGTLVQLLNADQPLSQFPYFKLGSLAVIVAIFFVVPLSSLTNYTFLYFYFYSQWIQKRHPEQLDIWMGTIESIDHVSFPYAGSFKRIQLCTNDGRVIICYIKDTAAA